MEEVLDKTPLPEIPVLKRAGWEALPPLSSQALQKPVLYVRFTYEDDKNFPPQVKDIHALRKAMRASQKRYMDAGLADVPYK